MLSTTTETKQVTDTRGETPGDQPGLIDGDNSNQPATPGGMVRDMLGKYGGDGVGMDGVESAVLGRNVSRMDVLRGDVLRGDVLRGDGFGRIPDAVPLDLERRVEDKSLPYDVHSTKNGKLFRRVNVDPRSVAFIIGRNHGNLRKMGCNVKDQSGKSIYIKYIQPERYQWGFFKLTSESNETLDLGERLLKAKEAEFLKLFQEGRLAPAYRNGRVDDLSGQRRFDGMVSALPKSCQTGPDENGWTTVVRR
jgi:hypothetical protein